MRQKVFLQDPGTFTSEARPSAYLLQLHTHGSTSHITLLPSSSRNIYTLPCRKRHATAESARRPSWYWYVTANVTMIVKLLRLLCFLQVPGITTIYATGGGMPLQMWPQGPPGMSLQTSS